MIIALPLGIIIGIVLALAPGPVAIGAMKLSMSKGEKEGVLFSVGSGLMDFMFCSFSFFATSAIISALGNFSTKHPFIILNVQIVIVLCIILYGLYQFKTIKRMADKTSVNNNKKNKLIESLKSRGPFFIGIAVALANVASPTFMPTLAGLTLWIQSKNIYTVSLLSNMLLSLGFGIGNFIWLYFIVRLITHYKNKFSENFIALLYKFAGYSLIGVGTILGYNVIRFTKWSEILSIALTL
jgi:threonine/homoserine/homoserine lactone efflux protein